MQLLMDVLCRILSNAIIIDDGGDKTYTVSMIYYFIRSFITSAQQGDLYILFVVILIISRRLFTDTAHSMSYAVSSSYSWRSWMQPLEQAESRACPGYVHVCAALVCISEIMIFIMARMAEFLTGTMYLWAAHHQQQQALHSSNSVTLLYKTKEMWKYRGR